MITKEKKKEIINNLTDKLSKQKVVIFSDFTGLGVNQVRSLRKSLKNSGIDYLVAKKTLIGLALKQAGIKGVSPKDLQGQISVTFGYDDEIMPAKTLYQFSKANEALKILAGIVNGKYLSAEDIINLANLPSKQQLLAKLVGSISSPMSGFLNALQGNLKSFIYLLNNIKQEIKA